MLLEFGRTITKPIHDESSRSSYILKVGVGHSAGGSMAQDEPFAVTVIPTAVTLGRTFDSGACKVDVREN